ncbi:MAG TPA: glycosyltransferase family 2 protein [Tepidisphaeraceae bacterium]|nr:glycosyltransferase family 2 protein [Tepidisphaeraceae bacterium]
MAHPGAAPAGGLSVVVPVYNSEATLADLAARLEPVLRAAAAAGAFELILVNDGSRDASWRVISELIARYPSWVRGVDLARNFGQHNALLCGVRAARFNTVVTIDDDLQNPPEEIPKLLARLDQGFDVVYGPPERQQHGMLRDLASSITKMVLQNAMGADTARSISAFRAFRTRLRGAFADYRSPYVNLDVLLTWGTTRFTAVAVRHEPRARGASNYTLRKLMVHALNMMTGFSTWPLRVASLLGFAFTLLGIGVFVFVVARFAVRGTPVQGFPFLASIIAIFSGAQLFALGVIGEYLARIHLRGMERPTYAVREAAGESAGEAS